ncbi:type I CRISPR-associated protein Cas7 [Candidatus Micrarchaeota archaeon]|nr:type I CRISPR-associated protein Cas7 [Candidatus Micrarchaeota archaeon]MBU1166259.1 type I CRISPR-associated protein Cas7 [Candidatus Micrarchaeota archaeon]MBU1887488.1 type I CRISPR-associated protein Cas7 [Candidatus Micrarchaeota archaeon]
MEDKKTNETDVNYTKFACGIFIVRADNANFNADFSGMPRELPDGRIYSTDKALKYCIRKYLHEVTGENVFVWRRYNADGNPFTLQENMARSDLKGSNPLEKALNNIDIRLFGATLAIGKEKQKTEDSDVEPETNEVDTEESETDINSLSYSSAVTLELLKDNWGDFFDNTEFEKILSAIISKEKKVKISSKDGDDYEIKIAKTKLTPKKLEIKNKKNFSITGPCQITYGINAFENKSQPYPSQIQSAYASKRGDSQTTLGLQHRADEVHYVFDFTINPNNLQEDGPINAILKNNAKNYYLKEKDVIKFIESMRYGVNYVTSTTKTGAIGEFLLFVEFERKNSVTGPIPVPFVPILQTKVKITKPNSDGTSKRTIDIQGVLEVLKKFEENYTITKKIYCAKDFVELDSIPEKDILEIY